MPHVAGIGHRLELQDLLDKFGFEDLDEAEIALDEAGITIFTNNTDDVFVTITDKYKIIEKDICYDLNFTLTEDEENILTTYTGQTNKRIKLFWFEQEEDPINPAAMLGEILGKMSIITDDEEDEEDEEEDDEENEGEEI